MIKTTPKKKMVLTEHQKEKMKENRATVPSLYSSIDNSMDASMSQFPELNVTRNDSMLRYKAGKKFLSPVSQQTLEKGADPKNFTKLLSPSLSVCLSGCPSLHQKSDWTKIHISGNIIDRVTKLCTQVYLY